MAILSEPNEIELVVTWLCNWHCPYCAVDTHNRPKMTTQDVDVKLCNVPMNGVVTLSGGEVGMLKRPLVEHIIDTLVRKNCVININTNGLFISRYPDLLPKFKLVLYHCTEDLNASDSIIITDAPNVEYMVVVTDDNYHALDAFLEKYPDIQFHLVASTMPDGINGATLNSRLKHQMLVMYHHRMTHDSKRRIFKEKDFDSIQYL